MYEAYKGRKPNIEHIHIFGCIAHTKVDTPHLRKLDDRSRMLVHLGTEPGSKAYRLLNPINRKVAVGRDVIFDENKRWDWKRCDKEDTGMFSVEIGEYGNHGIDEGEVDIKQEDEEEDTTTLDHDLENQEEEESVAEDAGLRRSQRETRKPSYLDDYILLAEVEGERLLLSINDEPWDFGEAKEKKVWRDACDDEIKSIIKNNTWDLVELPARAKEIGLKWIFKVKRNSDGSINKFKARLVAKGYIQRHGIDFDEVSVPVARIETVQFILSLAASRGWEVHHLDVKTAFLHGNLKEEVYVS